MKRALKYLVIFIIIISFTTSGASAKEWVVPELEEHNFGEFTAPAPKGVKYHEDLSEMFHYYINEDEGIAYIYVSSEFINNETINMVYNRFNEMGFTIENTVGNLTIFKINDNYISEYAKYAVEVHTDGKLVCIATNNIGELKEIGRTVEFH